MSDDYSAIKTRMREIRKEQGQPDDDWRTAAGSDLEAIAAFYDMTRDNDQTDEQLRTKIEVHIYHMAGRF
jgi:hypothetical protein